MPAITACAARCVAGLFGARPVSKASSPADDDKLMTAAASDREAFGALVLRYARRLQGLCFRYLGSEEEAADTAQDTFVRIYQKRKRYRQGTNFRTWLFQTARYLCLDRLEHRRRGKAREARLKEPAEISVAQPARDAELSEQLSTLATAIARLPASYYEVVNLHVYQGMSFPEIAEVLGAPVTTVKSRMSKALELLRRELGDSPADAR